FSGETNVRSNALSDVFIPRFWVLSNVALHQFDTFCVIYENYFDACLAEPFQIPCIGSSFTHDDSGNFEQKYCARTHCTWGQRRKYSAICVVTAEPSIPQARDLTVRSRIS